MNLDEMKDEFSEKDSYKDIDEIDICSLVARTVHDSEPNKSVFIDEDGMFEEYGYRDRDSHLGAVEW